MERETEVEIRWDRLVRVADGVDVPRFGYAIKGDSLYKDRTLLGSVVAKRIKRSSFGLSYERVPVAESVTISYVPLSF